MESNAVTSFSVGRLEADNCQIWILTITEFQSGYV